MQFDHDLQSSYADLFLQLREMFLSFEALHEIQNAKQTSYKDSDGMAIVLMRVRDDGVRLIFARGAELEETFPFLLGEGKIVRHVIIRSMEDVKNIPIREMIGESLVLAMEHREMRKMRKNIL